MGILLLIMTICFAMSSVFVICRIYKLQTHLIEILELMRGNLELMDKVRDLSHSSFQSLSHLFEQHLEKNHGIRREREDSDDGK